MKLGKKPARPGAVKFKLSTYVDTTVLPRPPRRFGHTDLIHDWKVLGNDWYGDCVFAGAAHETMLWNAEQGMTIPFDNQSVLSDYGAVTGFNPADPSSDQGTDMQEAASYRRKVGILDSWGQRHQIAAYIALEPGNLNELHLAMWLFGGVGIGFEFPAQAMDQFERGATWSVPRRPQIEGGHYVPLLGRGYHVQCVTWGRVQAMTSGFYQRFNDETLAYVSHERLNTMSGRTLEGFDRDTLMRDLAALGR